MDLIIERVLEVLFPDFDIATDCSITDEGEGQFISEWHRAEPQPSEEALQNTWADIQADVQLTDLKKRKRLDITAAYQAAADYIDCECSDGNTYRMDAGPAHAERMDQGYRLALDASEPAMVVIDYNNQQHPAVPIAIANEIRLQQSLDARDNYWGKWVALKAQADAAVTVADLDLVVW